MVTALSRIQAMLFLAFNFGHGVQRTRYLKIQQDVNILDHFSDIQPLKFQSTASKAACSSECLKENACGSFFYRDNTCAMYPSRMNAVYSVISEVGWLFYHKNQSKFL